MTDLEITRLCAEAIGNNFRRSIVHHYHNPYMVGYYSLHTDEQAMALLKKFKLQIATFTGGWVVIPCVAERTVEYPFDIPNNNLNRAVVECVAKMQLEKQAA